MRFTFAKNLVAAALMTTLGISASMADEAENKVNIWNWSDYIAQDTVENFTKATGIKTNYALFDSNELVEARLLSGRTGYDALMMTSYYVPRLGKAGALIPIDKTKIPNYKNLDPKRMEMLAQIDIDNTYAIPYTEISLGIGYNTKKIAEIFGSDYKVDSWEFLLDPKNSAKLRQCGIAVLDSPIEVISAVMHYLKKDPTSEERADYLEAREVLTALAKNVAYFHSSRYIDDLASGDICVAIGYSGDILQANDRAVAAKRDYNIEYVLPKEGSLLWFDCWVMPKSAPHQENGYAWINYILDPEVSASISKEIRYILPNVEAIPKLDEALLNNSSVNISPELLSRCYFPKPTTAKVSRLTNNVWNYMKLNSNAPDDSGWE